LFDQDWAVKPDCATCPPGYKLSSDGQYCDLIPVENTNYCFSFCRGGIDAGGNYGVYGAQIQETTTSTPVSRLSNFWGGSCGSCTRTQGVTTPAPVMDTLKGKSGETVVSNEAMLIPTGSCTRSDYGENFPCGPGLCGRLATAGIWLCMGTNNNSGLPSNEWIGFETCLDITTAKNYYIGYAVDNHIRIYIDGVLWKSMTTTSQNTFRYWYVSPAYLSAGHHTLRVEFNNESGTAAAAVEVYDNTYAELITPGFDQNMAHILFSTARDITGKPVQAYRDIVGSSRIARYTCSNGTLPDVCTNVGCGRIPVNRVVNPYVKGYAGNWRMSENKGFQSNRKYADIFNPDKKGMEVKNAGTLESFKSYWYYLNTGGVQKWTEVNPASKEWVSDETVTLYDKHGRDLEEKNALGKYSAALYMFRSVVPAAVASNARSREIYYDGFEDYQFRYGCGIMDSSCNTPIFKSLQPMPPFPVTIATVEMHTGNYSTALPGLGMSLVTNVHTKEHKQEDYLAIDGSGQYKTRDVTGLYPVGFEPVVGGKYIFNAWVKDGQPTVNAPGITLTVNGVAITMTMKSVVEKWKQVEGIVDLSQIPITDGKITMLVKASSPGSTVFFDDVRIHPMDSHMKTYSYDDKSMRLLAEMDENNYATFYEYDDEGSLIRIKKETERGIKTIKENRYSSKKRN
jgi:hypothetical protein